MSNQSPFTDADAQSPAIPVHFIAKSRLDNAIETLDPAHQAWVRSQQFQAAPGELIALPGADGEAQAYLFGAASDSDPEGALQAGSLATRLPPATYRLVSDWAELDMTLAALAFGMGSYKFTRYKAGPAARPQLVLDDTADAELVRNQVDAICLVRDLINTPANDMGPADLDAATRALAEEFGADYSTIVGAGLLEQNFPMIHAVGRAADQAPRLLDFTWGDENAPKITLVGKGVCFDTGGLDIKPASAMLLMKKDMGGAANVLGLARMIMAGGLKVRLRVLIPAVENSISAGAFRPGDVLPSRSGRSVEIGNTDAEGRLVLADALTLAGEDDPELIIDMATLTGAARVALGPDLPPFFTTNQTLAAELGNIGAAIADPVWQLPLWPPYAKLLASKVADINHISAGPFAGSITAALFLQKFVPDASKWLHFDIFGWTPKPKPAHPEGGNAMAIRALFALLKSRYGH